MQTRAILRVGFREIDQATLNLPADRSGEAGYVIQTGEAGYVIQTKPSQSFVSPTHPPLPQNQAKSIFCLTNPPTPSP